MRLHLLSICLLLTGCDLLSPKSDLSVAMDSSVYHRAPSGQATVLFTVRNTGIRPLYFAGCGSSPITAHVDAATGGQWQPVFDSGTYCLQDALSLPIALLPGATHRDSLTWDIPATYRLRVVYGTTADNAFSREAPGVEFTIR